MQKETFGKLLIILRKKNGLSQKELAERLISFYFCGKQMGEWKESSGYDDD